jgi:hypothetical protein
MKTYSEKLRDPRWQKKRLEILNRDHFTCQKCGDTTTELQVHHIKYSAKNPWEEPNENMDSLCKNCHQTIEIISDVLYWSTYFGDRVYDYHKIKISRTHGFEFISLIFENMFLMQVGGQWIFSGPKTTQKLFDFLKVNYKFDE